MDIAAIMGALFNVVLVVVLVAAMLSAGFSTTLAMLGQVLKRFWLVVLVFVSALVIRPLVGWGAAALFGLATPAFIALVMAASVPGAPLGVIFAMKAKADIPVAATFQVLLALVAAFTFAPTANFIIGAAGMGDEFSLPVADMVKTIVVLQVIPFLVGLLVRHFNEEAALDWNESCKKVTGPGLLVIIALGLLGSWQMIIDLIGDRVILAAIVFTVVMILVGYFVSSGDKGTRKATGMILPNANAGPALAGVGIAFNNDPEILGAMIAIILLGIIITAPIGTWLGGGKGEEGAPAEAPAA